MKFVSCVHFCFSFKFLILIWCEFLEYQGWYACAIVNWEYNFVCNTFWASFCCICLSLHVLSFFSKNFLANFVILSPNSACFHESFVKLHRNWARVFFTYLNFKSVIIIIYRWSCDFILSVIDQLLQLSCNSCHLLMMLILACGVVRGGCWNKKYQRLLGLLIGSSVRNLSRPRYDFMRIDS